MIFRLIKNDKLKLIFRNAMMGMLRDIVVNYRVNIFRSVTAALARTHAAVYRHIVRIENTRNQLKRNITIMCALKINS